MTLTTGQNQISELTLRYTGYNVTLNRFEITYRINRSTIEPISHIDWKDTTFYIRNTPAQLDEEGVEVVPADNALTDFINEIDSVENMVEHSLNKAVEHAAMVEYVDNTDDLWDEEGIPEGVEIKDWIVGEEVAIGFARKFNGINYRCRQKHTTQANWTPDISPSLWGVIPEIGGGGYPLWVAPTGAHDAYDVGAIVHFPTVDDPLYINNSPANTYAPDVFGWDLYTP